MLLQRFVGLQEILDYGRLLDIRPVLFAVAIFALGWRSSKTAGAARLHSVTLCTTVLISESEADKQRQMARPAF